MDAFITDVLSALIDHGARAVRVFPPSSQVLLAFADRLAVEVVRVASLPAVSPHSRSAGRRVHHIAAHTRSRDRERGVPQGRGGDVPRGVAHRRRARPGRWRAERLADLAHTR